MKLEKFKSLVGKTSASLSSLLKVMLMSRGASPSADNGKGRSIIILGNGPSLRKTLDLDIDRLLTYDMMAVNFAANTPEFFLLRPNYYILADAHFFSGRDSDPNVKKLWENFEKVTWDLTLFVPSKYRHFIKALLINAPELKIKFFSLTPLEGFEWLTHGLIDMGLGMPRPRNVMIPAIICAIREGFSKIYLCGADHTWTRTLSVDEENFVVSIQPHFYNDNEEENKRVRSTYKGLKLHDVLGSMTVAFRSYWEIAAYARKKKVEIINATPGSMIDAFPRMSRIP